MRRLRRKAQQRHIREHSKFKRRAISAGAAVAITLGTAAITNKAFAADPPDLHQLPVSQDADTDLLADTEEAALAYLAFNPDQNRNGTADGIELARLCAADINDLPWGNQAEPNETYKWWAPQFGVETCDICGATLVMGPGGVVNPQLGISVQFPFLMTLHYMEHGSFSYAAHYSEAPVKGRADVAALLKALDLRLPYEPNDHQLPVPCDADEDLLANKEETAIGYQLFNPDQNHNQILDGVELAKRCCEVVKGLPLKLPDFFESFFR